MYGRKILKLFIERMGQGKRIRKLVSKAFTEGIWDDNIIPTNPVFIRERASSPEQTPY